jgi:hypothetical protein
MRIKWKIEGMGQNGVCVMKLFVGQFKWRL